MQLLETLPLSIILSCESMRSRAFLRGTSYSMYRMMVHYWIHFLVAKSTHVHVYVHVTICNRPEVVDEGRKERETVGPLPGQRMSLEHSLQ